jgi:sporulation protein YlmC with PRC-barrel domain
MRAKQLLGKQVVGADGWKIGKVKEIVFDEKSWQIQSLEVELDRSVAEEYDMKKLLSRTSLQVAVSSVKAVGDHFLLSVTKSELRRMISHETEPPPSAGAFGEGYVPPKG